MDDGKRTPACRAEAERLITWSDSGTRDQMRVQATGPNCADADITAIITSAGGVELLRAPALGYAMAQYGENTPSPLPPVPVAEITAYVDSIATSAWVLTASELPAWPAGEQHLPRAAEGASYDALLSRNAYEELRTRNVRVLCLDTGPEAATCYAYDPVSRSAIAIAAHGV